MTDENDSFFKEVDEGVRQDRYAKMAKRFGPWAAGGFVAILIGVGGQQVWQQHTEQEAQSQASVFAATQEQARGADIAAAATKFQTLSNEGPQAYRVLSMMEHAAALQAQGDLQGAVAGFDAAAAAAKDPVMRDTARIRAAYIVADTQDFQAVRTRLQPLIQGGGQMSFVAKELLAVEAWEAGQNDLARDTLEGLQLAFEAPESIRQRAQLTLAVLPPRSTPASPTTPPSGAPAGAPAHNAAPSAPPSHGESQ